MSEFNQTTTSMAELSGIPQLPVNAVSNRLVFLQTETGN